VWSGSRIHHGSLQASGRKKHAGEPRFLGCPEVIDLQASPLNYILGLMLVTGVDFIVMPNILRAARLRAGLIQRDVTPEKLVRAPQPA